MPYSMRKNPDGTYRVVNALTGKVHMKSGSKEDAEAQLRILHAADAGKPLSGLRRRHR